MNLFELNQTYRDLEEREDLDSKVLADTLDSINDAREIKLDNIAYWIEKNKMQLDWLSEKTQRFKSKANITQQLKSFFARLHDTSIR